MKKVMKKDSRRREWDGRRIRALREHMGLTQQEMADQLGTRQQTISEWETGMYQPRGASSTLLTLVAERAGFEYSTHEPGTKRKKRKQGQMPRSLNQPERVGVTDQMAPG